MGKPKVKIKENQDKEELQQQQQHKQQQQEQQHDHKTSPNQQRTSNKRIREVSWRYDSKNLSIITSVKINKRDIDAVIDSGAQVSVLNEEVYKSLCNPPVLSETVSLKGVGIVNQ